MKPQKTTTTVKANAKLNLFLDITGRLGNGYHSLNTIMQSVSLADDVTVNVHDTDKTEIKIKCDNSLIPVDERNIAFLAATLFLNMTKATACLDIDIKKPIPVEAGLGGSSTDGAAVLLALNEIYGKPYSIQELAKKSSTLGADVPFCVQGGCMLCTGTGTVTEKLAVPNKCAFLIIKPNISCNTREAYSLYDKAPLPVNTDFDSFLNTLKTKGLLDCADKMYNVFEKLYEENIVLSSTLSDIRERLLKTGARGASLTGSGSAIFGVYENETEAENALSAFKYSETTAFITLPVERI